MIKQIIRTLQKTFLLISILASAPAEKTMASAPALPTAEDSVFAASHYFLSPAASEKISEKKHLDILLQKYLHAEPGHTLELVRIETDQLGYRHYRYRQTVLGLPVEGSYFYVHVRNGNVVNMNGVFLHTGITSLPSLISSTEALQSISYSEPADSILQRAQLCLVVKGTSFIPAWRMQKTVNSSDDTENISYVDAVDGKIIRTESTVRHISVTSQVNSLYNGLITITSDSSAGGTFTLVDSTRGTGIEVRNLNGINGTSSSTAITDTTSAWNSYTGSGAADVMYGLEKTYDYFLNEHGRNSIDNAGMYLKGMINFGTPAYSYYTGNIFAFGLGTGSYLPFTSFEIVAHEYIHGVVAYSAAFGNAYEPIALNESFSDILAVAAEYYTNPGNYNFDIGEKCSINNTPQRSMRRPSLYNHADTYNGTNYGLDVYSRATVQDYWFYLICDGGQGVNDLGNIYSVEGIGIEKAAKIAYRALTVYLGPTSGFAQSRTATIQAAIDLYGSCSPEEIAVTRAWYGVGVGGEYSGGVVANACSDKTSYCKSENIAFLNRSLGASSYFWDFGDNTTDTATSPVHQYSSGGNYTVQLIATGTTGCQTVDTFLFPVYIQIYNSLVAPNCQVTRTGPGDTRGIYEVSVGDNRHISEGSIVENYMDFTCEKPFEVPQSDNFTLQVITGSQFPEIVSVFIDYNNDGYFTNIEAVGNSSSLAPIKNIFIPTKPITPNIPLRLRVISSNNFSSWGCPTIQRGQCEDHTIIFTLPDTLPSADFYADQPILHTGEIATFINTGTEIQTCNWYFPGGTPSVSSAINPKIKYNVPGIYPVTLIVSNSFGQDSITKTEYIFVDSTYSLCASERAVSPTGTLYDNGGPNGNIVQGICSFTIRPDCADTVFLWFTQFSIGYSFMNIYDIDSNGVKTLLFSWDGHTLPTALVSPSGRVRVYVNSATSSSTLPGFTLHWTSVSSPSTPVTADFYPDNYNPALNSTVQMINLTTGTINNDYWDFGDGATSQSSSPKHEYDLPGTYLINYIAEGCLNTDTVVKTVVVQDEPQPAVNEDSLEFSVSCGDSISFPVTVYNTGGGDLIYKLTAMCNMNDTIRALIYKVNADTSTYSYNIAPVITNYVGPFLSEYFNSADTAAFRQSLNGKTLLVFPILLTYSGDDEYNRLAPILEDFMINGGNIVMYYSRKHIIEDNDNRLRASGLMNGYHLLDVFNTPCQFLTIDTTPPLGMDLGNFPMLNYFDNDLTQISNKHRHNYVLTSNYEVLSNLKRGKGSFTMLSAQTKAISSSGLLSYPNTLVRNTLLMGRYRYPSFLSSDLEEDTLSAGDSSIITYTIRPSSIDTGTYTTTIEIRTNSNSDSLKTIHLTLHVTGTAAVEFDNTCSLVDTTAIGYMTTQPITLHNVGCAPLKIYSASFNTPYFSGNPDSITILAGSSGNYNIHFMPDSNGTFYDTVYLQTNIGVISQCIYGVGRIGAQFQTTPIPTLTINACGDSASGGFWIKNPGELPLFFNLTGGEDSLPRNLGVILYGVDTIHEYANIRNILQQSGLNIHIDTISFLVDTAMNNFIKGKDLMLIPKQESGSYLNNQYSKWSHPYLSDGGNILAFGTNIHLTQNNMYLSMLSGCLYSMIDTINFTNGTVINPDTNDYFTKYTSPTFGAPQTSYPLRLYNSSPSFLNMYNNSVLGSNNCSGGYVHYLGFDYDQYNASTAQVLINVVKHFNRKPFPKGVNIWPLVDTIPGGDSIYINIGINLDYIAQGHYPLNVLLNSTSPLVEPDSITMYIDVMGNPCAAFYTNMDSSCNGIVQFYDRSLNNPTSWLWNFGDGNTSVLQNPIHYYSGSGNRTARLTVSNALGIDSTIQIVYSIDHTIRTLMHNGIQVSGNNISFIIIPQITYFTSNASWNYGDGTPIYSGSQNGSNHQFANPGTYIVSVTLPTTYCSYTLYDTITISAVGLQQLEGFSNVQVLPNPFVQQTEIKYTLEKTVTMEIQLMDISGRLLETILPSSTLIAGDYSYICKPSSPGMYLLRFVVDGIPVTQQLVKTE